MYLVHATFFLIIVFISDVTVMVCVCFWAGLRSAPTKRCATIFKRKRWCVEHTVLMTQELQLWQLWRPFFVFSMKNSSEPDEVCINMCLILQNIPDVTVTALAALNTREHLNRVKGFVKLNWRTEMEAHILPTTHLFSLTYWLYL